MNLATRLGMRTEEERQQAREKNVAEIKRRIRNGDETVMVLEHEVKCVDANTASGYRFTGSGLAFYAGKVIERIDWTDQGSSAAVAKAESQQAKESNVKETGYQGYENYETWNVALWLGNDYGAYHYWQERAEAIKNVVANGDCGQVQDGIWTAERATRFLLADELKATYTDHPLTNNATMYADILTDAMGKVDWEEVADSILEE